MRDHNMVRVLGPVDVWTPAGAIEVGGARQRALLGALATGAGRAVSADQLQQVVWGDDPPRTATNTLQTYISHVRELLGDAAIIRRDHSYKLDLRVVDVDALEFERLVRRARADDDASRRWRLCRAALRLWRGAAFGDLADEPSFQLETYRLEELRLTAMELSMGADLELGRHDLVVGELESAVREYPYRERLWHLLVRALVLGDRRVEALRTCEELRRVLADAGITPGEELAELEAAIRHGAGHEAAG